MRSVCYGCMFVMMAVGMVQFCGCRIHGGEHGGVHWGYGGATGPAHWGELSEAYILARTGRQQSPIDITGAKVTRGGLEIRYKSTALDLVNNGHAIEQGYEAGSVLKVGGKSYELKQFHIHSPSEHTVGGKRYDMEMHLVHKSASDEIAVVSVLFQKGKENSFLKRFWDRLPEKPGEKSCDGGLQVNANDVLPGDRSCFVYQGSLTTPPCTEGVSWYIFAAPTELSAGQLASFQKLHKGNFRPVQPLNGRTISRY